MPHTRRGQHVDDRRVALPALDHQVGRHGPVGQVAHPLQVGTAFSGQGLDHAQAAGLGDCRGQLGAGDVGHRRLNDGILDAEQGLDAIGHGPLNRRCMTRTDSRTSHFYIECFMILEWPSHPCR